MASRRTVPDAIRHLFGIDVARDSPLLKTKANSLVRNRLIKVEKELIVDRSSTYLAPGQEVVLFNALLLNAVFSDPKQIKSIFEKPAERQHAADTLRALFSQRNSLLGIGLSNPDAMAMVEALAGHHDLYTERLPNPFARLPQVATGDNLNLLQALLAQAAVLAPGDSMLLAYLQGDLARAADLAETLESNEPAVEALRRHLIDKHSEARDFDSLLDQFKKM
uniref:hypothetical protein n=1 Tax=Marinobacterium profundum TaxID=1714300 RepID=UPI00082ECB57|nr:hypothetical protein [Marinobacterium profundum]